jgi:predicted DNA-binding transcriptional regulator AlpA
MNTLPLPSFLDDERIIDLTTFSAMAGLSIATTRRLIKTGQGPRLVRLSARRVGVRIGDVRRWLEHRTGA